MKIDMVMSGELSQLSVDEKVDLAKNLIAHIQQCWRRLAAVLWSLKQDGYDTTALGVPLRGMLEKAARGTLLIEAIEKWYDNELLLRRIATLPIVDQKNLMNTGSVPVIEGASHRMVPLDIIKPEQINIVFAKGKVRTLEEQAVEINKAALNCKTRNATPIIHDLNGDMIDTNGMKPISDIVAWLKDRGYVRVR